MCDGASWRIRERDRERALVPPREPGNVGRWPNWYVATAPSSRGVLGYTGGRSTELHGEPRSEDHMISSLRRGSRSRLLLVLVLTALFGPSAAHAQQRSAAYAGTRFWV